MARYINADAFDRYVRDMQVFCDSLWDVQSVLMELKHYPTKDVKPVVHAYWIEGEDLNCNPVIRCSACKDVWHTEPYSDAIGDHFYFCPNCGAVMDEEVS